MHSAVIESPRRLWTGVLMAAVGAVAFSGKAVIVKLAYRYGVDAVTLIMYRMLFALPLFIALSLWAGRDRAALTGRELRLLLGLGFSGYYVSSFLDFAGLQYISVGLERLILYLNPTVVMLLGLILFRTPVLAHQWLAFALSYLGVIVAFGHDLSVQGPDAAYGALLVLAATFSYALYMVFGAQAVKQLGALRVTGVATSIASGFCIGQFLLLRPLSAMRVAPEVIWLSALNATLCTFCPVLLLMLAMERVGATVAAQTAMIGPLSTIALGTLILDEPFTPAMAIGTVLVLAGVALLTRPRRS